MVDLAMAQDNNQQVRKLVVYVPHLDLVVSSDYTSGSIEDSTEKEMIMSYENGDIEKRTIEDGGNKTFLCLYNQEIIMTRDFPLTGADKLATIYYVLEKDEFYRQLTKDLMKGASLYVSDSNGNSVFDEEQIAADMSEQDRPFSGIEDQADHVFAKESDMLGWEFIYFLDESLALPSKQAVFLTVCPIILMILLVFCLVALLIAFYFYRPVYRVLKTLKGQGLVIQGRSPNIRNEMDYLKHTVSEMLGHQMELDAIVQNTSSDIIDRFFRDCLDGKQMSYENAKEILKNTQSDFKANAYYTVSVVKVLDSFNGDKPGEGTLSHELQTALRHANQENQVLFYLVKENDNTFSVILSFDDYLPYIKMQKIVSDLSETVILHLRRRGIAAEWGRGNIYHSILDIGFAHSEAERTSASSDGYASKIEERANQMFTLAVQKEDAAGAATLAERVVEEIGNLEIDLPEMTGHCKMLLAKLLEQIVHLEFIDISMFPNELFHLAEEETDKNGVLQKTLDSCLAIIEKLEEMLRRQKNRHLIAAQEYIASHYSDVGISLNSVADAIGVNSSYLSKLFTGNLGINFTHYLNRHRINCSKELLADMEIPIKDVASRCGFNSVQNFIRVFKKYTGKTPGQYREEISK